ncbi:MAG: DUF2163 domain-containing protein [Alphaproteobacteria bacterium]|nr:DUF2163 domain-containing protein [Alphaproteobacteria bacterium]
MKTLPLSLAASLASGATTLCYCWKVTRADGLVLGFTDHDRALVFDGVVYAAGSGLAATALEASLGLGIDNLDVEGALSSASLTEDDLAAGRYDDATVEIYRVDWRDVASRVLLRVGTIGEVRRGTTAFAAEIRGLTHRLNQPTGRLYQFGCDADLGDARCGVSLSDPSFRGDGAVVTANDRRRFTASGLGAYAAEWFARGRLTWTSGANAGLAMEVKFHSRIETTVTLALWQAMPFTVAAGDAFTVTAGCDKQFATCRAKFGNGVNFRGHPHMPGNDWVVSFPARGEKNDGASRRA